jgi:protein ImuB
MGVRRFGECLRLPRAGLARRLGRELVNDLDRALGRLPDPRPPYTPPPRFRAGLPLPAEVEDTGALLFAAHRLVLGLAGYLSGRGAGVVSLTLGLGHDHRPATPVRLALAAPNRDADHLMMLLRERLAAVSLPAPVTGLVLDSDEIASLAPTSRALFPGAQADPGHAQALLERLRARLGPEAVRGLRSVAEHRPELAWAYTRGAAPVPTVPLPPRLRPPWLLAVPRPLAARDGRPCLDGPLALENGPERIESGWWDGHDVARDYFIARDASGACFWIFHELREPARWFLHGIFA